MKYESVDHFFHDAINKLMVSMSPEDLEKVKRTEDVIDIQHTFGRGLINYFGLWNVNRHLGNPMLLAIRFTEIFKQHIEKSKHGT